MSTSTVEPLRRVMAWCLVADDQQRDLCLHAFQLMEAHPIETVFFFTAEEMAAYAPTHRECWVTFLLIGTSRDGRSVANATRILHQLPELRRTRTVLLGGVTLEELSALINQGAVCRHLSDPVDARNLADVLSSLLTGSPTTCAPDEWSEISSSTRSFLRERLLTDVEIEEAAIASLDAALHHPARISVPAGGIIMREDEPVDCFFLLLNGKVRLSRGIDGEDIIFHSRTAGRVIGLMSLAHGLRAFFTCTAATDSTLMRVSYDELDAGLQSSPEVSIPFITLLLRSMARRNQRAVQQQIDIHRLNRVLSQERDQLRQALSQLKNAQMRLVESEKMATLGQLVAGIGHELNNPVAAIVRAAEFTAEDVRSLAQQLDDREALLLLLERALTGETLSTRDQRARATDLQGDLGDADLASRVARLGLRSASEFYLLVPHNTPEGREQRLAGLEKYHQLGTSLRTLKTGSERIARLVAGLRSYARAGREWEHGVDLIAEIEETLIVLGHQLKQIELVRDYGKIPPMTCRPGELNQVWTNLISNAAQAMNGKGRLTIATGMHDAEIFVMINDTGHGITPENMAKIFDINFTTKQGRVDFGLGLGLPICKNIIERHGGRLDVSSRPGDTRFTVWLPIGPVSGDESPQELP